MQYCDFGSLIYNIFALAIEIKVVITKDHAPDVNMIQSHLVFATMICKSIQTTNQLCERQGL